MRLRAYVPSHDFEIIKNWITDERTHAMWCAGHMVFPLEREDYHAALAKMFDLHGDCPFIAVDDGGKPVGMICCSVNYETNESMLAFVAVDPRQRGKGVGREMVRLAAKYCFEMLKAERVQLNVFDVNEPARRCYGSAGFTVRSVTDGAFAYNDEKWGRVNMVMDRSRL